jgi:hypothetical protein
MRFALRFHAALLVASLGIALAVVATSNPSAGEAASAVAPRTPGVGAPAAPDGRAPPDRPRLLRLPDPAATGRGHTFTDAGLGLPAAAPTELERAKLEEARAAVEASRRAGTLFAPPRPEPRLVLPEFDPARKLSLLKLRPPASLRPDAAAGLSLEHRPIQRVGPPGLNAVERAKRDRTPLPARPAAAPARADEARVPGDGATGPSDPSGPRAPP